jgi:hypothetical protein
VPKVLKDRIRHYLEYMWEKKSNFKIEEGEVMSMLN